MAAWSASLSRHETGKNKEMGNCGCLQTQNPVSLFLSGEARKARKRKALELWARFKNRGAAGRAIFLNWHFQARFYFLCQFPRPQVPVHMFQRLCEVWRYSTIKDFKCSTNFHVEYWMFSAKLKSVLKLCSSFICFSSFVCPIFNAETSDSILSNLQSILSSLLLMGWSNVAIACKSSFVNAIFSPPLQCLSNLLSGCSIPQLKYKVHFILSIVDTLSGQRDTRSEKSQFLPLFRCFPSAYVQYASIKRLAGTKIDFFPTLWPWP